jgi:hypothetical protein
MEDMQTPEHLAVRVWLDASSRKLNLEGLERLESSLKAEVTATVKRYKEFNRQIPVRAQTSRYVTRSLADVRQERAQAHQYLQVVKPVLRWVRAYRTQFQLGRAIQKPYGLGEFLLSKALREAPKALWEPLSDKASWNFRNAATAVTCYQQTLAQTLIKDNPSLFSGLPGIQGALPTAYTVQARAAREKVVTARMQIVNKVKAANILTEDEMRTLLAMV